MSAALRPMSSAEFLAWEERQELRYEFNGVAAEAMVGGTASHSLIQVNLAVVLVPALRGRGCRFIGNDVKLPVGRSWRYPDGMVVCVPIKPTATFVTAPTVVFEVLSDSTRRNDMSVKIDEYRSIASIRRYVMLEQDRVAATVFSREGDEWLGRRLVGPTALLDMPEIDVRAIPLARLYEGVEMNEAAAALS